MLAWPRRKAQELIRLVAMPTRNNMRWPVRLTETQLRGLSKDDLVAYALEHAAPPSSPLAPLSTNLAVGDVANKTVAAPVVASEPPGHVGCPRTRPASEAEKPGKRRRRAERPFDMSKYGQRMIAIKFSYFGWHFHGLASQPHSELSVEDHLFEALLRTKLIISRVDCDYSRAGRTDVGVSALGQVAGLRVRSNVVFPSKGRVELDYVKILNSALPPQIRVLCWAPVCGGSEEEDRGGREGRGDVASTSLFSEPVRRHAVVNNAVVESEIVRRPGEKFSARFDAIHRSYKYFFARGALDIQRMRTACGFFVGRHDFRNFCKIDVEKVTNFERVMYEVDILPVDSRVEKHDTSMEDGSEGEFDMYYVFVRGQAFLWHQIRCMVAILFEVGRGREDPTIVQQMLNGAKLARGPFSVGKPSYQMAPPGPLLLYECAYPRSVVDFSIEEPAFFTSFSFADANLASQFGLLSAQSAIGREMLTRNDIMVVPPPSRMHPSSELVAFGQCRTKRLLLPPSAGRQRNSETYVPLEKRARETSVWEKQQSLEQRKSRKA